MIVCPRRGDRPGCPPPEPESLEVNVRRLLPLAVAVLATLACSADRGTGGIGFDRLPRLLGPDRRPERWPETGLGSPPRLALGR